MVIGVMLHDVVCRGAEINESPSSRGLCYGNSIPRTLNSTVNRNALVTQIEMGHDKIFLRAHTAINS
ncbi:hypothetical protein D3C78_1760350 [compost metagenome]